MTLKEKALSLPAHKVHEAVSVLMELEVLDAIPLPQPRGSPPVVVTTPVEELAKVLYEHSHPGPTFHSWEDLSDTGKDEWCSDIRAVLGALNVEVT